MRGVRDGEDGGASGIVVNEDEKENDDVCDSSIEMSFFLDYFARKVYSGSARSATLKFCQHFIEKKVLSSCVNNLIVFPYSEVVILAVLILHCPILAKISKREKFGKTILTIFFFNKCVDTKKFG